MRSTVTGETLKGPELDAAYWVKNLRDPVLFSAVTQRLIEGGHTVFVEMSPHPILLPAIEENLQEKRREGVAVGSLRRNMDERRTMLEGLGAVYARGFPVDWKRLYPSGGRCVDLPTNAWQRARYWVEGARLRADSKPEGAPAAFEGWLLAPRWQRQERAPGSPAPGPWLVLTDRGGVGEALVERLRARGATAVRAVAGTSLRRIERDLWEIDPGDPHAYASLLRDAFTGGPPCRGVVSLFGLDAPRPRRRRRRS